MSIKHKDKIAAFEALVGEINDAPVLFLETQPTPDDNLPDVCRIEEKISEALHVFMFFSEDHHVSCILDKGQYFRIKR